MRGFLPVSLFFVGLACLPARAADCSTYRGNPAAATKDVSTVLDKTLAALHAKNIRALYALSDKKVLLVRRVVSNSEDRSGNFRLELHQRDLDGNLNIHMGGQVLSDLAQPGLFAALATDNVTAVRRDICEDARKCEDGLPGSEQIPFMLNDLLQCNQSGKAIYKYEDGIYVTDMASSNGKLPVGTALFFNKSGAGYRLAGVIIQN